VYKNQLMGLTDTKRKEALFYTDRASESIENNDPEGALGNLESAKKIYQEAQARLSEKVKVSKARILEGEKLHTFEGDGLFYVEDYDHIETIGDLYCKTGNYLEAIAIYEWVLTGSSWADKLGDVYYEKLGEFKKAWDIYKEDYLHNRNPRAAFQLGMMSWNGDGVDPDVVNALKWFNIAWLDSEKRYQFHPGDPEDFISKAKNKLESEMTVAQIEKSYDLTKGEIDRRKEEESERKRSDPWQEVGV